VLDGVMKRDQLNRVLCECEIPQRQVRLVNDKQRAHLDDYG